METTADLGEVYARCYPRLVAQMAAVIGDVAEAEDVVQEAVVRALARWPKTKKLDNPEAWLRVVALNLVRSRWRRLRNARRFAPKLVDAAHTDELSPDRLVLLQALRELPLAQREALVLHHIADLPVEEVADTLGVPEGTVKARLSRGRAALAQRLTEREEVTDHA